jgi:hypothetical protein
MIRLLDACVTALSEQGMQRLFVDAISGGDEGFQSTGRALPRILTTQILCADVGLQGSKNGQGTGTYGEKLRFAYMAWVLLLCGPICPTLG